MKSVFWCWFFVGLCCAAAESQPAAESGLSLGWVLDQVLTNNPSLKASQANWRAWQERIPQARAWQDLRLGVDVERQDQRNPFGYSDSEWMISQEVPLSGKNKLRGKIATSEAFMAFLDFRRKELDLLAAARIAYFRLGNARAQIDLTRKSKGLWEQFTAITRGKYEVGAQSQADLLAAQTELAKVDEALVSAERNVADAESELNRLMGRPPAAIGMQPTLSEPQHAHLDPDRLREIALDLRPEIRIGRARIEAARHRVDLARKEWIPDPEFRIEARQVSGTGRVVNEYDTGVFFKFPWLTRGKYSAMVREAGRGVEGAGYDLQAIEQETARAVKDLVRKAETFHHHYELFKERLLPLAEQTVASKRSVYEANKGTFLELLTAQRTAQEVESMVWNHLTDYHIALAELESTVGAPVTPASSPAPRVEPKEGTP